MFFSVMLTYCIMLHSKKLVHFVSAYLPYLLWSEYKKGIVSSCCLLIFIHDNYYSWGSWYSVLSLLLRWRAMERMQRYLCLLVAVLIDWLTSCSEVCRVKESLCLEVIVFKGHFKAAQKLIINQNCWFRSPHKFDMVKIAFEIFLKCYLIPQCLHIKEPFWVNLVCLICIKHKPFLFVQSHQRQ